MNKRSFLLVTGLGLGLVACADEDEVVDEVLAEEPAEAPVELELPSDGTPDLPTEEGPAPETADGELPTWDEVKSGHPEGATNPPIPELIVTPDGDCYKDWRPGMLLPPPGEPVGDRIQECGEGVDCGTRIQCPEERMQALMEAVEEEG